MQGLHARSNHILPFRFSSLPSFLSVKIPPGLNLYPCLRRILTTSDFKLVAVKVDIDVA